MNPIADSWAPALLDAACPVPAGLRTWNGSDPAPRFAVYRNNVVTSLVAALADTFPVVRELVGGEFFDAMARLFVAAHPPASPVLTEYGDRFPAYIESFPPTAAVPYLADVARLERQRVRTFHAADAPALDAAHVAARLADPDALASARVTLHPSAAVLVSRFAIVSLWAAHQGHGDIAQVDPDLPEAALVLRRDDDAAVIGVGHAAAAFIGALADGGTLAAAADAGAQADPADGVAFDLAAALSLLIGHGVISQWHADQPHKESI